MKSHILGNKAAEHLIEFYLDYTCPFSAKAYKTLVDDVVPFVTQYHPNKFSIVFRHQVQCWHPQATLLHEAALAVDTINPKAFFEYSTILFSHQEQFFDINTYNKTRMDMYKELAELAANVHVEPKKVLELLEYSKTAGDAKNAGNAVTEKLKSTLRIARHNHIHVTPTVMIDGLEVSKISSSWKLDQWREYLASFD